MAPLALLLGTIGALSPSLANAAGAGYFMPQAASHAPVGLGGTVMLPLPPSAAKHDFSLRASAPPREVAPDTLQSAIRHLGPLSVEQDSTTPLALEHGVTTLFAFPVKAIPGLELTASFFGGHRDTRLGAPAGSAAVTGGIRFRW